MPLRPYSAEWIPGSPVGLVTSWNCPRQLEFQLSCLISLKSTSMVLLSHVLLWGLENTYRILMCVRLSPINPKHLPQYSLGCYFACFFSLPVQKIPSLLKKKKSQIILTILLWGCRFTAK